MPGWGPGHCLTHLPGRGQQQTETATLGPVGAQGQMGLVSRLFARMASLSPDTGSEGRAHHEKPLRHC